ncbi:unnamed protein product [Ostreobium quekettii]|uniref:F-box domain-containing protein n=1 Tax=Ostreobium quekettii TaxID=121088 RepID=A0A8S1JEI4_9CHLO|nr:unnamed protein product [Ostreobium quekettii]
MMRCSPLAGAGQTLAAPPAPFLGATALRLDRLDPAPRAATSLGLRRREAAGGANSRHQIPKAPVPICAMSDWGHLPRDLFGLILPLLRRPDLRSANLVSRHWRAHAQAAVTLWRPTPPALGLSRRVSALLPSITGLDFEHCCEHLTDDRLKSLLRDLRGLKKLRAVTLACCSGVSSRGLQALADEIPRLEYLSLRAWSAHDGCLGAGHTELSPLGVLDPPQHPFPSEKVLAAFTALRHLDLSWNPIEDAALAALAQLTGLTGLQVKECSRLTDEGVPHIAALPNLRYLNLSNTQVSDEGLMLLMDAQLESLCLSKCSRVSDDGLYWVGRMGTVRQLDLSLCGGLTSAGIEQLKGLPCLSVLHLGGCRSISPSGVVALEGLTHLEVLNLRDCPWVSDATLGVLAKCATLRAIGLRNCGLVGDAGLKAVAVLPGMESLNLRGCEKVTDDGLRTLAAVTALQDLDLSYCGSVTDWGVAAIATLPKLRRLVLNWCRQVSAEGLMHLRERRHTLRQLSIKGCHMLSSANLVSIASSLPVLEEVDYELCQCSVQVDVCQGAGCGTTRLPDMSRIDSVGCFQEVC